MVKSTRSSARRESAKPYPSFPLTPHPSGRWCKKHKGRLHYFGKLSDGPEAALERFKREWTAIVEGRALPRVDTTGGCTVRTLCNAFLASKERLVAEGELSPRSGKDYHEICGVLVDHFGPDRRVDDLRPDDFEKLRSKLAAGRSGRTCGAHTLHNLVNRVRVVMKYAADNRLVDRPVHFGQGFARPSTKALRRARHQAGPKMFEADELRRILAVAKPVLRAMTLLAVNTGFGNTDIGSLPKSALDLDAGWVSFPRVKTEIRRRVPLWRETVAALREAIAVRPPPKDPADDRLVFLTVRGVPWVRVTTEGTDLSQVSIVDAIPLQWRVLLERAGVPSGRGFYCLRHVFETVAGESRDQVAVDACMGHVDATMAGNYRERISDERLQHVVETVRAWLFSAPQDPNLGPVQKNTNGIS